MVETVDGGKQLIIRLKFPLNNGFNIFYLYIRFSNGGSFTNSKIWMKHLCFCISKIDGNKIMNKLRK